MADVNANSHHYYQCFIHNKSGLVELSKVLYQSKPSVAMRDRKERKNVASREEGEREKTQRGRDARGKRGGPVRERVGEREAQCV